MASNREREETYICLCRHTHEQSSRHAKEHMLNHHWSFPGNKKKSLCGLKSSEWNIREVQSSALTEKRKGKSLSCRVRAEESEVGGGGAVIAGKKGVMSRGRQTDKRAKAIGGGREKGPHKLAKGSQGLSPLCISFTWLAVSTNRIGSGARGLGRRIKTPNAFTALIPLSHNTLSVLLFFRSLSLLPASP